MKGRRWGLGRILFATAALLFLSLLPLVGYVYYNPFFLIDRGTSAYLRVHHVFSRWVQVDGNRIHYLEAVPAAGAPERPVVLVHGLGARAMDWAPLIPMLAEHGYHVYAPDLLGYGESAKPPDGDFSLRGEMGLVAGFMQSVHVPRADVGGWSMGGWISMLLALDHPETVNRLALFDSAGLYFNPDFGSELFSPGDRAGLERLVARIEPDQPVLRLPGFAVPGMLRRLQENRWIVDRSFRSMVSGREVLDFRAARLHLPVLLVWGTEDKLTPFSQAERLHKLMPQSVLLGLRGCGHLAPAECAAQVTPTLLRFLGAKPPLKPEAQVLDGRNRRAP